MKQKIEKSNLKQIKAEFERRLIVMRYSGHTIKNYMYFFGCVENFLKGYGQTNYSKEMGQRFIVEYTLQPKPSPTQFRHAKTVVHRMDEILENKLFAPRFCEPKQECPAQFAQWKDKYIEELTKSGLKKATIVGHNRYVGNLFAYLADSVTDITKLSAADLYDVFTRHEWHSCKLGAVRGILSFLFRNGATKTDLSVCVPKPRRPRSLPSVYSGNEVTRLLSSVDRTTHVGKRDYAILMLAARLGLRSSDIVNLSFKNIDHDKKTIEIVQVKTSSPLTLVLNGDIKEAINDYVENGRPQAASDKIFITRRAPYLPITAAAGYAIANKYFRLAGIASQGRKQGTHALRASYATALVAKGIPYVVVQEALGHDDPDSSKHYVRVDVKRLRNCAIDVPKPAGAFAIALGDLEGVL